jgi:hypothetical protein
MDSFRVKPFIRRHFKKRAHNIAARFGSVRQTGNPEVISAAGDFYMEAAFDLSQVFVELSAKIGETAVISGLQDEFLGYLDGVQGWVVKPL